MKRWLNIWVMILSVVILVPICLMAQNSPKDYLEGHNAARANVGSKPLIWDKKLESSARRFIQEHIEDCLIGVKYVAPNKYAYNLAYHPRSINGANAVAVWVKLKEKYDEKSNSCIDGNPKSCAPYLRVVWSTTTSVGCAREKCHHNKGMLIRCEYEPSGIIPGHERPYPYPRIIN
ncbi:hypothetical protein PIB30_002028 [Stylosanthes scabra]|uniref:SCP domain-containing protein n=1 Tax=Stylosanthes scabra TaxID=79078 RepID=A0ABU6Q3U5_9FABA|nr:hypothetical protein [Stylosanthes scabra]